MPVTPFLQKMHNICSDTTYLEICGWGRENDSIFIKNIEEFAKVVLPKYFKHANYTSFIRQLHKYDFHKTVHNPRHGEFKHKYFIKDQPELMEKIQRKVYVSKTVTPSPTAVVDSSGMTDGETDGSSDKDGSRSESDTDFDFDFLMDDDNNNNVELDFDQFDEIESSVERGMIAFDDERISVLEKRQAFLMEDNETTKNEIFENLKLNGEMTKVMENLLDCAKATEENRQKEQHTDSADSPDNMNDLCGEMKAKCNFGENLSDEMQTFITSIL